MSHSTPPKGLAGRAMNRPVTTIMVFVSFLAVGVIASRMLPLEYFPELDAPFLFIQIPYPGSSPQEVERQITRPAEQALATLSGIKTLNSESSPNNANIFITFEWGKDLSIRAVEARDRLESVRDELPEDVRRINVFKFNTSDQAILTLRISSERDLSQAYDLLQRNLVRPVERVPGVARVNLQGVEPKEVRIELIADLIDAMNVDLADLNQRLQRANFSISAGEIDDGLRRARIVPMGEFRSIEEIENFRINDLGVRLKDVANVYYGPGERNYARHLDQRYAVGLEIFKERGANMVAVGQAVLKVVAEAGESPEMQGIELFFLENLPEGVVSSLQDLLSAGLIGALLSLIVLYYFLRSIPTTLMVSLAVPISLTIALGFMYFMDISLNVLSMMGMMLAIGMLVDNAVVVSESIFHERELHPGNPERAARQGVSNVALAIAAGTLTTAVVFLPNLFGERNQIQIFLSHVAVPIVVALGASLLIAQTMIPLLAAKLPSPSKGVKRNSIHKLKSVYERWLRWTVVRPRITMSLLVLVLIASVIPFSVVKTEMNPPSQDRDLFLLYNLDSDYTLDKIKQAVDKIETYLYANAEEFNIRSVYSYYDENGTAQSSILLTDDSEATLSSTVIRERIREGLPKIAIGRPTFASERSIGGEGFSVAITGESSEKLSEILPDAMRALRSIEGLKDIKSERATGGQELAVRVDRERALALGMSTAQVAQQISVALRGTQLRDFRSVEGEVPVRLQFREQDSQSVEQLTSLTIRTPDGGEVPIQAVAEIRQTTGPITIRRQNRETALSIQGTLVEDTTFDDIREDVERVMDAVQFPPGYGWKFGSGFTFEDDTGERLMRNLLLAILFIFIVLAALFESMLYPLTIITSILFSVIGVYWFFMVTGTIFSLMANIGLLILVGVVVNNGIVMIDHINQLRASGMDRAEALVQGARDRLRPILMTVFTTVLGLLPLCIGTTQIGGDGPPYFPMARAIVGGLLFSTLISLAFMPMIYMTLDNLRLWARTVWRKATSQEPLLDSRVAKAGK